jgi:hypothetical protein
MKGTIYRGHSVSEKVADHTNIVSCCNLDTLDRMEQRGRNAQHRRLARALFEPLSNGPEIVRMRPACFLLTCVVCATVASGRLCYVDIHKMDWREGKSDRPRYHSLGTQGQGFRYLTIATGERDHLRLGAKYRSNLCFRSR